MNLTQTDNLDEVLLSLQSRKEKLERIAAMQAQVANLERVVMTGSRARQVVRVITDVVCETCNVSHAEIMDRCRTEEISRRRQIVFYLSRVIACVPYERIGEVFGMDHGTVIYGHRRIKEMMSVDPAFQLLVEDIKAKCEERLKV